MPRLSLSACVLLALIAGLGFGLLLSPAAPDIIERVVGIIQPIGTLFVNGIRMTVIPLAVGAVFVAYLYRTESTATQIPKAGATAGLTSFCIPGVRNASIIAMVPVLASVGLPTDGMGLLLGVDTVRDAFRTTAHGTGQMAAALIAERPRA